MHNALSMILRTLVKDRVSDILRRFDMARFLIT